MNNPLKSEEWQVENDADFFKGWAEVRDDNLRNRRELIEKLWVPDSFYERAVFPNSTAAVIKSVKM